MAQTPAQKLRTRNLAAARRSLKLIAEAAAADLATLENGGVPDLGAFRASTPKYEQALLSVVLLDSLDDSLAIEANGADGSGPPEVEVRHDDLAALVALVRDFITETGANPDEGDTSYTRLTAALQNGQPEPAAAGAE